MFSDQMKHTQLHFSLWFICLQKISSSCYNALFMFWILDTISHTTSKWVRWSIITSLFRTQVCQWDSRWGRTMVILRVFYFYAQSKNISTYILVTEAHWVPPRKFFFFFSFNKLDMRMSCVIANWVSSSYEEVCIIVALWLE